MCVLGDVHKKKKKTQPPHKAIMEHMPVKEHIWKTQIYKPYTLQFFFFLKALQCAVLPCHTEISVDCSVWVHMMRQFYLLLLFPSVAPLSCLGGIHTMSIEHWPCCIYRTVSHMTEMVRYLFLYFGTLKIVRALFFCTTVHFLCILTKTINKCKKGGEKKIYNTSYILAKKVHK